MSEIKQGYKQTKVGIIPEDWDVERIDKVLQRVRKSVKVEKNKQYYQIGIRSHGKGLFFKEPVSGEMLGNKSVFWIEPDSIIVNIVFAWEQAVARTTKNEIGMIASHRFPMYQSKNKKADIDYLVYLFKSPRGKYFLELASPGGAGRNKTLGQNEFGELKIPLPPLKEQEKIAEILTTWDEAITKQTELLEAKELLKIALMQKLLSGEVRFSGFSDEWEEVRLGEICKITTGKLNANAMVENGQYTFFTCARETYKINEFAFDTEALLVSGNGANVGYIHYFKGKFNAYQRTYVLDDFEHDIFLIKYLLDKYLSLQISREKNEGNTPYITLPTLTKMKLKLPSLAEQQKIAEVLSLADDEINLLKNELEKLKLQKKALMQKLLTGQVRVKV